MNRQSLLHIVERLEGFLGKLPETIRKPILRELTPLKELFLQQRPPRFVFAGSHESPIAQVLETLFERDITGNAEDKAMKADHWQEINLSEHGAMSILDVRGADISKTSGIRTQLNREPADMVLFFSEDEGARGLQKIDLQNLTTCLELGDKSGLKAKVIGIVLLSSKRVSTRTDGEHDTFSTTQSALEINAGDRFLGMFQFSRAKDQSSKESQRLMSILARELPNESRIEMIRISGDREAQREVAQILVKSTAAVCTAIGAQPIPLADLPILTTLQLLMVSGIMYVSGRERSLRAATEFIGALGANIGVGMLFREGTRALLKFFPGWGNLICGMVAGAGTYAIGRAATLFFLEGVSLKDARQVYLKSRKRPVRPTLGPAKQARKVAKRRK